VKETHLKAFDGAAESLHVGRGPFVVHHSAAGGEPLHIARTQKALVAHGVAMLELALEHHRHGLEPVEVVKAWRESAQGSFPGR
jgi:hypothetical protein